MRLQHGGLGLADYLTVEETAQALGYHPEYVRRMVRKCKLRADRKSGVWLIYREAVEEYRAAVAGKSKNDPTRGA